MPSYALFEKWAQAIPLRQRIYRQNGKKNGVKNKLNVIMCPNMAVGKNASYVSMHFLKT